MFWHTSRHLREVPLYMFSFIRSSELQARYTGVQRPGYEAGLLYVVDQMSVRFSL